MIRTFLLASVAILISAQAAAQALEPSADGWVATAREAARQNRHGEAIDAFRKAMAAAPDRQSEWRLELADQLTWSGRLDDAIALYRSALAAGGDGARRAAQIGLARALSWQGRHVAAIAVYDERLADNPTDLEARLARAQVLSWADQLKPSQSAYEAILRDHPDNLEAARGRARVLTWRGRQREAMAQLDALEKAHPADRESRAIQIEALSWMGRPDRAMTAARSHLATDPGDGRTARLLADLEHRQRPAVRGDLRLFDQSDDLDIEQLTIEARVPLADGRAAVGVHYGLGLYQPPDGPVNRIQVDQIGARASYRVSDALDVNGRLSLDIIETRGTRDDHRIVTYETFVTLTPNDWLRVDLGSSRWTFDSEPTLRSGLVATQVNGSADVQIDHRTRASVRASWTDYSDGNSRTYWQVQADRRVFRKPDVTVSYRFTTFDFTRPGQPGYYNPDRYRSHDLMVQASHWIGDRLRWDVRAVIGREKERGNTPRTTISAGAGLSWTLHRNADLELGYDYSSSRTFATGGFARSIARVGLVTRF